MSNNDYWVLDVETVGFAGAAAFLEGNVSAPANYKDPDKIADYIKTETANRIAKAALDLDLAEVVALGCVRASDLLRMTQAEVADTILTRDRLEEAKMLEMVRDVLRPTRNAQGHEELGSAAFVTFNGRCYDLPLLLRRAMYLGVPAPHITMDRYRTPHVDLYDRLTHTGAVSAHKLSWYAKRFGWTETSTIDGAGVAQAVAEGRWSDIREHCACDLLWTARLAERMGVL